MEKATCSVCFKPKATLVCGACSEPVCKYCAEFLQDEDFAYLTERPEKLLKDTFCGPCFQKDIAPELQNYRSTLEKAKDILVFSKVENKETRYIRRDEDRIEVKDCDDREDVLLFH